jgi:hypothetical protein
MIGDGVDGFALRGGLLGSRGDRIGRSNPRSQKRGLGHPAVKSEEFDSGWGKSGLLGPRKGHNQGF